MRNAKKQGDSVIYTAIRITALGALSGLALATSAQAEVVIHKGQTTGPWWQHIDFQIGGSIRPQYVNEMGTSDDGSYKHKIYDGGTRFRFTGEYELTPHTRLLAYYEPGVDIFHTLDIHDHYDGDSRRITTRQRYFGIGDDTWGTLTLGKQYNPYYSTVGIKTDVWDHDMLAQGSTAGINADVDGQYKGRRLLNYQNSFGPVDLYLAAELPSSHLHVPDGPTYKRKGGGAIGLDYHLNKQFTLSLAYTYTSGRLKLGNERQDEQQQLAGAALTWDSGPWYASLGGGYYHDFVPARTTTEYLGRYLVDDAYGVEGYLSHEFAIDNAVLRKIKPYLAADRLQLTSAPLYQRSDEFLGVAFYLRHGFRVDLERTFTQSSDDLADQNWVRLRYDF